MLNLEGLAHQTYCVFEKVIVKRLPMRVRTGRGTSVDQFRRFRNVNRI